MIDSRERHVGGLCSVPTGHLRVSLQLHQFSKTCLDNHSFFFAFVKKLLLSLSQSIIICQSISLESIGEFYICWSSVECGINLSSVEGRVKGRPCRHEELLLIASNIDHTVFVLHQMIHTRSGIECWRHTHWRAHKSEERHF